MRARSGMSRTLFGVVLALVALAVLPSAAFAELPEAPVTEAPSPLTGTTATLNGELNPGASEERVSYHFIYSPGEGCGGFLAAPGEPPFPEAEGSHKHVSVPVVGLEAHTIYRVCLVAANPLEEAEASTGSSIEFTTPASKPVVVSESATGVSPFAATLQAEVNPENESTTSCIFEYGKAALGENKLPCEQLEFSGGSPRPATRALAGLSPGTKYRFRVVVKNATGETKGAEQIFETLTAEKPSVASESANALTPFQARLEGVLNPNFQLTKCSFSYGITVTENKVGCEPELFEGFGEQSFGATVMGLTPETVYHYRVLAKNAAGETEGGEQEFTTPALQAPVFDSENPSGITSTDAQLEARINPDAQETSATFEYSTEESLVQNGEGTQVSAVSLPAVFEEVTAGPVDLGGNLTPGTTYFYRVVAKNETGETQGPVEQFTTSPPEPPTVGSESVSEVSETGATFEAAIDPQGREATYSFEYATDEGFTENAGSVPVEEVLTLPALSEELPTEPVPVSGLKGSTTYFYRAVASNPIMGTTDGPTQSFKTLGKPAIVVEAAEELTRTSASITGTVNPGGTNTTYRVDYVPCPKEGVTCAYSGGASSSTRSIAATSYTPEPAGPVTLEELTPGTRYQYTITATNSTGTTVGPDQTFKTLAALPPTATINPATNISVTTATISGAVDTKGLATSTRFLISTEAEPSSVSVPATITSQSGNTLQLSANLEGLQPGTTYTITLTATNSDGTIESTSATLTTSTAPSVFTLPAIPPSIPFTTLTTISTKETEENHENIQRELLNKALKTCKRKHNKHKRAACERQARRKHKP